VSWNGATSGATINLNNQTLNAGGAAGDTATNFEVIYLTTFADTFTGDSSGLYVYGFGGNDKITTGAGTDFVDGGPGADTIDTGVGFDYVSWNSSTAAVTVNLSNPAANTGDAAGDTVANAEAFYLTEFNDIFVGQNGQDVVFGQGGNDSLTGGANANDWLFGGAGNDVITGGTLNDLLSGGDGADTYVFTSSSNNGFDQVLDFTSGLDKFQLTGAGFGLAPGSIFTPGVNFVTSTAPLPAVAGGTLLYNTANGIMSYDIDGTGPTAAVALFQIAGTPTPVVLASDFVVV